ncbi:conserved hypothetical protein [Corynebacterium efficiens YS-314]|uniref:Transposase n=1 Tax=Corynebacterium efficiens (strain DSM 44549 / YS-314 / AJ 12310 / JCM 11189 / NBRC 100395) TaxID=196164 RepID=Q8FTX8_COREF|nr:conserved hypothetical protein [Corynebacterium efficiens YS-314]
MAWWQITFLSQNVGMLGVYQTGVRSESPSSMSVTEAERIRQLEREVSRLREERDILRKAAKYFAEETNW